MDYFICQGSMRKLISVLTLIEDMNIRTYGVSIDKTLDKYKLFVLMSNVDLLKIRGTVANREGF